MYQVTPRCGLQDEKILRPFGRSFGQMALDPNRDFNEVYRNVTKLSGRLRPVRRDLAEMVVWGVRVSLEMEKTSRDFKEAYIILYIDRY